jgi:hypothetical protein
MPGTVFVGQSTFFEACAPGDAPFVEFRHDGDADLLLRRLRDLDPEVVVVFRPEVIPTGLFAELPDAAVLGFLTEPLPRMQGGGVAHEDLERRLWELEKVDGSGFDRVVSFDPHIAGAADAVLPVWRSVPLPVADRYFAPGAAPAGPPNPLFVGRSTEHREKLLERAKHHHDVLHLAFGVGADDLERVLREHNVGINLHNEPYPSFENRVCLHLAAGHLVLSEPLDPLHGLEPGIDFVEIADGGQLAHLLEVLQRFPATFDAVRIRGRRKAEQFRASRVWPRLIRDLRADLATFGRRTTHARASV